MANNENKKSFFEKFSKMKEVLLGIIAIVVAFTAWENQQIKAKIEEKLGNIEIQSKEFGKLSDQIHLSMDQKKFSNDQLFQLYREIKESINQKDNDQQLLLAMIIDEVMADNVRLRDSLRGYVLKHAPGNIAAKYIQEQTKAEKEFKHEQLQTTSNFKIDVFYLDDILTEAEPRAEQVVKLLQEKYPKYAIRKRLLPRAVNAQVGYNIQRNEIRFEESERQVANEIFNAITGAQIFNLEQPELHVITFHTANYISIFIRNM